jgi:Na+/melibiose symporter-like transporter
MKNRKELFSKMAYACVDIYGGGAFIIAGLLILVYLTNVEWFSGTLAGTIVFIYLLFHRFHHRDGSLQRYSFRHGKGL